MLIDTHAHLTDKRVLAQEVLNHMDADGLKRIITVGYNKETSFASLAIAKSDPRVFCSLGFHPSNSDEVQTGDYDEFLKLSRDERVVAIGEIGLDYHYDDTDKDTQRRVFLDQIDLANAAELPVILHVREADGDMQDILKANLHKLPKRGVLHCFSGSAESAKQYADMGFYISFSGTITFQNAKKAPDVIRAVPRDKILIETDCPYLAPHPFRGQNNYPKYVRYQAERIAEVLGLCYDEVADFTERNAYRCFEKLQ